MAQVISESFLQAESNYDASHDLLGDGYQGTMNYAAFTRPLLTLTDVSRHRSPVIHTC